MAPPHLDALELARINSKAVQRKVKQTASVANKLVDLANIMAGIDTNGEPQLLLNPELC